MERVNLLNSLLNSTIATTPFDTSYESIKLLEASWINPASVMRRFRTKILSPNSN